MRGMSAMALGAGPAHAMYFSALEQVKADLVQKRNVPEHVSSSEYKLIKMIISYNVLFWISKGKLGL